jgi:hypothetical protein
MVVTQQQVADDYTEDARSIYAVEKSIRATEQALNDLRGRVTSGERASHQARATRLPELNVFFLF